MTKEDPLAEIGMHAGARAITYRRAAELRKKMTKEELRVWYYLRSKPHGVKFRRQHPFDIYILDFYCHELRVCIEVDGPDHRFDKSRIVADKFRQAVLDDYGIKTLRVSNDDINERFDITIKHVDDFVNARKVERESSEDSKGGTFLSMPRP